MNISLPSMYIWQQKVFFNLLKNWKGTFHVVKSRRQCGKSVLEEIIALYSTLSKDKQRCYVLEPTFNQCDRLMNDLLEMVKGKPFYKNHNYVKRTINFKNGSQIRLFSSEQGEEALRGYTCEILLIDETGYISNKIINAVLPYVNVSNGPVVMVSTPRGRSGIFYDYYVMGNDPTKPLVFSYDWALEDVSALLSPERLELYRASMDALAFRTDYEGQFLDGLSRFFGDFSKCVYNKPLFCNEPVVFGIDWAGSTGGDYTAISIIGISGQLYDIIYFNDLEPQPTLDKIYNLAAKWKPKRITVETNSIGNIYFGLLRDELKRLNIPLVGFYTDNNSKDKIVSKLQVAFQKEKIKIFNDIELMDELEFYEMEFSKTGKRVFNAAKFHHDDCVIALCIGYNSLTAGNYAVY